ncbi:hypothetical protein C0Q70_18292 [Pomacea canaliculata]|uniref:Nose resistant-to-fluoxetine protein N-terminal domain-containing protein n=1 Tax=Pomacea canaliculata TaxID=400727 RepID=A0A2T7NMT6_POMCA|nr:hypothetical protein C0Q70_18292 [Pomacea canaliculata]
MFNVHLTSSRQQLYPAVPLIAIFTSKKIVSSISALDQRSTMTTAGGGYVVLLLLLFLSIHTETDAAEALSHVQRLELASRLTRGATADPASLITAPDVEKLLTLSSATVQQAVLTSSTTLSLSSSSSNDVASGAEVCANDTITTIMALTQRQMWAVRMVDAAGKPKPDILDGNFIWPGAYDVCFSIRSDVTGNRSSQFSGQYCTATVPLPVTSQGVFGPPVLSVGLCVPNSCSSSDITLILTDVLALLNTSLSVQVTCPEKTKPLDVKAKVAIAICSVLLALMVVGTVVDVVFIQMPKWWPQDKLDFAANGAAGPDEHQPLLQSQQTKASVPRLGRLTIRFSCESSLERQRK